MKVMVVKESNGKRQRAGRRLTLGAIIGREDSSEAPIFYVSDSLFLQG